MKNNLRKIVYFDENSAVDFLQVFHKGKLSETIKTINTLAGNFDGEVSGGVEAGKEGVSKMIDAITGISGKGKAGLDLGGKWDRNKVKTTLIENSVLYDFIKSVNRQRHQTIEILTDYQLKILPDTLTYYASFAPLTEMMEGESKIDPDISLKIDKMYSAIKALKGYFEVIGTRKSNEEVIFRFNLNSFKNNYRLQDLTKMSLLVYAIKVGEEKKSDLNFNKEFNNFDSSIDENDFLGFSGITVETTIAEEKNYEITLPVYDVYLAGVK